MEHAVAGNSLTAVMGSVCAVFKVATQNLLPSAVKLVATLALIDTMLKLFNDLMEDNFNPIGFLFRMIMKIGGWVFVVGHFPDLVNAWFEGCIWVAATASGNGQMVALLKDPSAIIEKGFTILNPFVVMFKGLGALSLTVSTLISMVTYLLLVICFFMMSWQMFMTYLEFFIVAAAAIMMLPFGAWDRTSFMSEKALGGIIASGGKVMVLGLILAGVFPEVKKFNLSATPGVEESLMLFGTMAALTFLTWQAHPIAMGVIGGMPSLSGGQAMNAAKTMAPAAGKAMSMGASASGAVARGALGGAQSLASTTPGLARATQAFGDDR
jgi:type IV secretion system protein TrbL